MYDLVIFDCDGVLVDSEHLSCEVLIALLQSFGVELDSDYVRRHFLGRSFPTVAAGIRRDFAVALPEDFEAVYRASLLDLFASRLRVTPGLGAVLDALRVPDCVATSSSPPRTSRALDIVGLTARFAGRVFTASEVPNGKPAPDLFLHVAARSGAAPARCLVIEDSAPGLMAAVAAGMPSLHYSGGTHLRDRPAGLRGTLGSIRDWAEFRALCPDLFAAARTA
jgi:HAD superfamily hydrolase (TIGR01509 family)